MDIKDSSTIDTKNISEVSVGKDGQFKFKMYCRDTALYKLAEILGLSEQKEEQGGITIVNNIPRPDNSKPD